MVIIIILKMMIPMIMFAITLIKYSDTKTDDKVIIKYYLPVIIICIFCKIQYCALLASKLQQKFLYQSVTVLQVKNAAAPFCDHMPQ